MSDKPRVAVSGSSGLIGSAVIDGLAGAGYEPVKLVRHIPEGPNEVLFKPAAGTIDSKDLEGIYAIIHLGAENLADSRWTEEKKASIRASRIHGTKLIARAAAELRNPPKVLLSASAIGYYGDCGDTPVDERSPAGTGFLAEVCQEWEAALQPAAAAPIRVVPMRMGLVLAKEGGALKKMRTAYNLGLGGRLGDGLQWMSWISMPDLITAIGVLLQATAITGPVNIVSPNSVRQQAFAKALGKVLKRPAFFPLPRAAATLVFGELATQTLLAGQRVMPTVLNNAGFQYQHPDVEGALGDVFGK